MGNFFRIFPLFLFALPLSCATTSSVHGMTCPNPNAGTWTAGLVRKVNNPLCPPIYAFETTIDPSTTALVHANEKNTECWADKVNGWCRVRLAHRLYLKEGTAETRCRLKSEDPNLLAGACSLFFHANHTNRRQTCEYKAFLIRSGDAK